MFSIIGGSRLRRSSTGSRMSAGSSDNGNVGPAIPFGGSVGSVQPHCPPMLMPSFGGVAPKGMMGRHATGGWASHGEYAGYYPASNTGSFSTLTDDLILTSLTYLMANDLLACSVACKGVRSYVDSDALWKELCRTKVAALLRENTLVPVGRYRWKVYGGSRDDAAASSLDLLRDRSRSATGSRSSSALSSMAEGGPTSSSNMGFGGRSAGRRASGEAAPTFANSGGGGGGGGDFQLPKHGMKRSASFADYSTVALSLASAGSGATTEARESWDRKQAVECVDHLLQELRLPSHRLLYLALPWLSLVGVWRHVPTDIRFDFRGELLGIGIWGGALVGEVVNPDSSRQLRFRVVFSPHEMSPKVLRVTAVKPSRHSCALSTGSTSAPSSSVPSSSTSHLATAAAPDSAAAPAVAPEAIPPSSSSSSSSSSTFAPPFDGDTATMHDLFATGGTEVTLWPERVPTSTARGGIGGSGDGNSGVSQNFRAPTYFTLEPLLSQLLPGHPRHQHLEVPSGAGPAHSDYSTNSGFLGQRQHGGGAVGGAGSTPSSASASTSSSSSSSASTTSTSAPSAFARPHFKRMSNSANSAHDYLAPGAEPPRAYSRLACPDVHLDLSEGGAVVNLPQAQFRLGIQRGNQRSQQQQHQGQFGGYHHQDDQSAEDHEQQGLSLVEEDAMDVEFRDAPIMVTDQGLSVSAPPPAPPRALNLLQQTLQPQHTNNGMAVPTTAVATAVVPSTATAGRARATVIPVSPAPLEYLCGLWAAPYGSHGLEILHLRTVGDDKFTTSSVRPRDKSRAAPSSSSTSAYPYSVSCFQPNLASWNNPSMMPHDRDTEVRRLLDNQDLGNSNGSPDKKNEQLPIPRLEGLKVVGDANVPASKLSFVVDSSQQFAAAERLAMDHRLVVAFPPEGAVIADLGLRRDNIAAWYRGMGQINRIQGVWEPDWVGIDFLVYKSGPVGFSVLWDEQGEVIRHIIDFVKLDLE